MIPDLVRATTLVADFRQAMRGLATTVTVLSTARGGFWHGMTATAVTSVSTDPAALLACVNQNASIHAHLEIGSRFCVNLLSRSHAPVSRAFSGQRAGQDRFSIGDWIADPYGTPFLRDAQANLFCTVDLLTPYATHTICVGLVDTVRRAELIEPLIYQDGGYVVAASASDA